MEKTDGTTNSYYDYYVNCSSSSSSSSDKQYNENSKLSDYVKYDVNSYYNSTSYYETTYKQVN